MKNSLFFFLLLATLLCGCSSDEPIEGKDAPVNKSVESILCKRTVKDAIEIASNAVSVLDDNSATSSRGNCRTVDPTTPIFAVRNMLSRSSKSDTLLYVVNYSDNNGFAIIPALKSMPEILAVSESGYFNPEEKSPIGGFNMWLDGIINAISDTYDITDIDTTGLYTRIPLPGDKEKTVVDTIWSSCVRSKLNVIWGQNGTDDLDFGYCEGFFCPNKTTGCAVTAAAMAMSYLQNTSTITLHHMGETTLSLNWDELTKYASSKKNEFTLYPTSQTGYKTREYLARLMRELGYRAHTNYDVKEGKGVSSTSMDGIHVMLRQMNLTSQKQYYTSFGYIPILKLGKSIAYVCGTDLSGNGAHAWIVDGLLSYAIRSRYYSSTDSGVTWKLVDTHVSDNRTMVHNNWGWNGMYNGYYDYSLLMPMKNGTPLGPNYSKNVCYYTITK